MGLYSKVKYVGKVFLKEPGKKTLVKKALRVLKNKGISGLKQAIKDTGEKQELAIDLYQKQQNTTKNYEEFPESILFVIWALQEDIDIDETYRLTVSQMKTQDCIVIVKAKEHKEWEESVKCSKIICEDINTCVHEILEQYEQDYIYFIKAGNYPAPNMRNEFAQMIHGSIPAVVYSDECIVHGDGSIAGYDLKADYSRYDLLQGNQDWQSVMFKRSLLSKQIKNIKCTECFENMVFQMMLCMLSEENKILHIDQVLLLKKNILDAKDLFVRCSILMKKLKEQGIEANALIENDKLKISSFACKNKASIIIVGQQTEKICRCIKDLIYHTKNVEYELLVVTTEEKLVHMTKNSIESDFVIGVPCTEKMSYTEKCNLAAEKADGDVLVFIKDDMCVQQTEWLSELIAVFAFPEVAAASPKIVRADNTVQYAGMIAGGFGFTAIPFNGEVNQYVRNFNEPLFLNRQISVLSSSCLAIRRDVFVKLNGFDQDNFTDKFCNAQLSFEVARAGYSCVYCAQSVLVSKSEEWYDSWYDKEHSSAYLQLLKNYGEELSQDRYFTESMKHLYLRGVPIDFRIYQKKKEVIAKKKSVLMISHDSLLGGATIAFQYAARALKKNGYHVVWLAATEGPMLEELKKEGFCFIIDPSFRGSDNWLNYANNFDLVICSTIILCSQVEKLKNLGKKVVWWVHEAKDYYAREIISAFSKHNLKYLNVWCGGAYAEKMFQEHFDGIDTRVLLYGMPDYAKNIERQLSPVIENPLNKMIFLSIGTFESRKGQDILVEAIDKLDPLVREKSLFVFIGKPIQDNIYAKIEELSKRYPDSVLIMKPVNRDTLMKLYQQGDVVLCTSREDPMPVFMTECMMQSKIAICSENTGTVGVLTDGWDSFVYHNNSAFELAEKISYVLEHSEEMDQIKENARKTYEKYFAMEVFEENLLAYVEKILEE